MRIEITGLDARYTMEQLCSMLLPGADGDCVCRVTCRDNRRSAAVRLKVGERTTRGAARCTVPPDPHTAVNLERRMVARATYRAICDYLEERPQWGMLSGVRPAKLVRAHLEQGGSARGAAGFLRREYDVSPEKAALCLETGRVAAALNRSFRPGDFYLYAHVPFCPTRCSYCSFITAAGDAFARWGGDYFRRLLDELSMLRRLTEARGMYGRGIYIGGGTPAIYSPEELTALCAALTAACGGNPEEFTVEAGRPDAITAEKLSALRRGGVTRICVNPQTMNDRTLTLIGRAHTAEDTRRAYLLAREAGFSTINCDLIAGLPGESVGDFGESLQEILSWDPENITVHTLAIKRGSSMNAAGVRQASPEELREMLALTEDTLRAAGYTPYYLYRQKYTGGGFENIGWAKPGRICRYNVAMMEEIGDIFSAGAGAVTKLTSREFARFSNPKYPAEYLAADGFDARYRELLAYYGD
ncbi:MAG: coproporphyrinogen dehydrogenase HemZ [Ruminococcaceae bacterium]|nr:coproporphyrinogen dehydrogenase HemZ [Oscillospiraceae bacterium]